MDNFELPLGVGPHEGAEYDLMLAGKKHIAMFSDYIPDEFVENKSALPLSRIEDREAFCTIFYLSGHQENALRLLDLTRASRGCGYVPQVEREIGGLLGYEDWQIEAFLKHVGALR